MSNFPPISCCDPLSLPRAEANGSRISVTVPNGRRLTSGQWVAIPVQHPSIVVPLGQIDTGALRVAPSLTGDQTSAATLSKTSYPAGPIIFLSAPGIWYVYNPGTSVMAVVLDATGSFDDRWADGYALPAHTQVNPNGVATSLLAYNAFRRFALIQNNGSTPVRIRWDGTNPTTTTGIRIAPGAFIEFEGHQLTRNAIVGIEESGSVTLDIVEGV